MTLFSVETIPLILVDLFCDSRAYSIYVCPRIVLVLVTTL